MDGNVRAGVSGKQGDGADAPWSKPCRRIQVAFGHPHGVSRIPPGPFSSLFLPQAAARRGSPIHAPCLEHYNGRTLPQAVAPMDPLQAESSGTRGRSTSGRPLLLRWGLPGKVLSVPPTIAKGMHIFRKILPALVRVGGITLTWLLVILLLVFYLGDWVMPWPDFYTRLAWVFLLTGLAAFLKVVWTPKGLTKKLFDRSNLLLIGGAGSFLLLIALAGVYGALSFGYTAETAASYAVVAALLVAVGSWMLTWAVRHRHIANGSARDHGAAIAPRVKEHAGFPK